MHSTHPHTCQPCQKIKTFDESPSDSRLDSSSVHTLYDSNAILVPRSIVWSMTTATAIVDCRVRLYKWLWAPVSLAHLWGLTVKSFLWVNHISIDIEQTSVHLSQNGIGFSSIVFACITVDSKPDHVCETSWILTSRVLDANWCSTAENNALQINPICIMKIVRKRGEWIYHICSTELANSCPHNHPPC